jgi:cathepsin D
MNREAGSSSSMVTFGGYDEKLMLEKPTFHNVSKQYYWSLPCSQILIGGEDTKICSEKQPCEVVVDSGTSLFTGPSKDLKILLCKPINLLNNL